MNRIYKEEVSWKAHGCNPKEPRGIYRHKEEHWRRFERDKTLLENCENNMTIDKITGKPAGWKLTLMFLCRRFTI